ncbi:MAG: heavy metal-associated domain-containing protein [Candidatus Altiarchaeota archaeon]
MIKKLKLNVEGMHCASCETLIKDVLSDENVKASVDSKKGEVIIEYDDSKINLDKIKSLIENEGYKVKN